MTDREARGVVTIEELRALRRSERAPEALQQRVSRRLARELAVGSRVASEASAAHRAWRPEPRSLGLGFAAAAALFALGELFRSPPRSGSAAQELVLAPEPGESVSLGPNGALPAPASPTPAGGAAQLAPGAAQAPNGAASTRGGSSRAEALVKKLGAPPLEPSSLGHPSPESQPGLLRNLPARSLVLPGFAATVEATVVEMPLPPALGPNLVTNGDFSHGTALWSVRRWDSFVGPTPTARAPFEIVHGALCTSMGGGELALGGWPWEDRSLSPHSFVLERGQRYRLSLRAWTKGPLPVALVFKVAHQYEPYDAALVATVPVTQLPHRFSVAFEPHADDDEAGIAFVASALTTREAPSGSSDLCIDDVRVTREAHQL